MSSGTRQGGCPRNSRGRSVPRQTRRQKDAEATPAVFPRHSCLARVRRGGGGACLHTVCDRGHCVDAFREPPADNEHCKRRVLLWLLCRPPSRPCSAGRAPKPSPRCLAQGRRLSRRARRVPRALLCRAGDVLCEHFRARVAGGVSGGVREGNDSQKSAALASDLELPLFPFQTVPFDFLPLLWKRHPRRGGLRLAVCALLKTFRNKVPSVVLWKRASHKAVCGGFPVMADRSAWPQPPRCPRSDGGAVSPAVGVFWGTTQQSQACSWAIV